MFLSKYTFLVDQDEGKDLIIMNYLTGAIDLVESSEQDELRKRFQENRWDGFSLSDYMLDRGYLFARREDEEELIQSKYLEFAEEYDNTPVQIIFSLTFACNFTCSYCYQEEYDEKAHSLSVEITDKFFAHINRQFAHETVRPYITMFGGEPLMGGASYKENILYFLKKAKEHDYSVAIVTNGYELINYLPQFVEMEAPIKEIQVTLDGDEEMHNKRRKTKSGEITFARIADGIDQALMNGFRINLRTVVDKENVRSLPGLAEYAQKRGWLNYPQELFETQLGRNYELHTCQKTDNLYNRINMWYDFLKIAQENPILHSYTKPQFHGMRYLSENGELPAPVFDACPAAKREWAYDINGGIYGCTASVGVPRFKLGDYMDPSFGENEEQILEWQTRDILTIEECSNCAVALSCGGGCGVLAANEKGKIHAPDCRPVKELLQVGAEYYGIGR